MKRDMEPKATLGPELMVTLGPEPKRKLGPKPEVTIGPGGQKPGKCPQALGGELLWLVFKSWTHYARKL